MIKALVSFCRTRLHRLTWKPVVLDDKHSLRNS